MPSIPGTILAAMVTPGDTAATFATHEDLYGKGGLIALASLSALSAIPIPRQKVGMLFYVDETSSYYRLTSVNYPLTGYALFANALDIVNPYLGTDLKSLSGEWDSVYTSVLNTSANWDSVYSSVNANSASYFTLSGGRINGNVTIFGNLTSTGTQTFANTIFSTTSALSVVHFGEGPALWIGNNGTGDIASFYDIDQNVEILHVGGNNGTFPNVGVKTSSPNVDLTVNGEISASETIYDAIGNSVQWNSVYNNTNSLSSNWQTAYAYVSANSVNLTASNVFVNNNLTVTNTVSANYFKGTIIDWMTLTRGFKIEPTFNSTIAGGDVYNYVYESFPTDKTYYRFIATNGSEDAYYETFSGGILSNLIAKKKIVV